MAGLVAFVILAFLPLALYAAWVVSLTGTFYNHEVVRFRQVIWIPETWRAEGIAAVFSQWVANLWFFLRHAAVIVLPALALPIAAALFAGRDAGVAFATWRSRAWPTAAIVALAAWVFFALVGFTVERLAYAVALPVVASLAVAASMIVGSIPDRPRRLGAVVAVVAVPLAAATVEVVRRQILF